MNAAGNNGKGVLVRLIQAFLGRYNNCSSETLNSLLTDRFSKAALFTKLANFDPEMKKTSFVRHGTENVKALTGNDMISGQFKFRDRFNFTNYAKLVFSCNTMPTIPVEDRNTAWAKRMIIINFTKTFYGSNDDAELTDKLTTENELSGLLNECLRRLPLVLKNGIRKITPENEKETWDKYDASQDPIEYFVMEALEKTDDNEDDKMTMSDMFEYFNGFREKNRLPSISEDILNSRLHAHGYKTKRFEKNWERTFHWFGVKKNEKWMEKEKDF